MIYGCYRLICPNKDVSEGRLARDNALSQKVPCTHHLTSIYNGQHVSSPQIIPHYWTNPCKSIPRTSERRTINRLPPYFHLDVRLFPHQQWPGNETWPARYQLLTTRSTRSDPFSRFLQRDEKSYEIFTPAPLFQDWQTRQFLYLVCRVLFASQRTMMLPMEHGPPNMYRPIYTVYETDSLSTHGRALWRRK